MNLNNKQSDPDVDIKIPVRSDSSAGGNHDKVGLWVLLWHEHDLAGGTSEHHFVSRLSVAKEVRAYAFLCWIVSLHLIVPVSCATDAKGGGFSLQQYYVMVFSHFMRHFF